MGIFCERWRYVRSARIVCCLFALSYNIRLFYVACLSSLATFTAPTLLVTSSCNIRDSYLSCLASLDKYNASIFLVDPISIDTVRTIYPSHHPQLTPPPIYFSQKRKSGTSREVSLTFY